MLCPMVHLLSCYTSTLPSVSVCTAPVCLSPVVPRCCVFHLGCSDIFWMIFIWFQLAPLFLVSLLFLHHTCALVLLWGLGILKSLRFLSSSHFCLLKSQCLLTDIFTFHYHGFWCPIIISIIIIIIIIIISSSSSIRSRSSSCNISST